MNTQQFSLAVVKGSSAGTSIQSTRQRISVGSADDNDLILTDPGIAPRHFSVLIDRGRWRVSSQTGTPSVNVDRRWSHPESGRRGALIQVAAAQIILYPGHLDARTIELEISRRQQDFVDAGLPTALDLPRLTLKDQAGTNATTATNRPGSTVPAIPAHVDPETIARMDTISAARPPEDLRIAAQGRLHEERLPDEPTSPLPGGRPRPAPSRPMGGPPVGATYAPRVNRETRDPPRWDAALTEPGEVDPPGDRESSTGRKKSAWDQAKQPARTITSPLPEVLATPESQIMPVPEEASRRPPVRPEVLGPVPPRDGPEPAPVPDRPANDRNAWGDTKKPPRWSAPSSRALVASGKRRSNAWSDAARRTGPPPDDPRKPNRDIDSENRRQRRTSQIRREALSGVRHKVSLDALRRRNDPGLHVLRAPDGPMATSVRLLGARVEELAQSLGHRAYMITSAEPLTGKTTTVLNLALALAEDTNRRVALVEADFRYPRFAEILGIDARLGLLPVIQGRARLADSALKVADRNLLLVPSGGRHRRPAEVLASPPFKSLMTELVDTVDVALIDAPSVHPFADTNLLLPLVDAAFLVVSQALTRRAWISEALHQLGRKRVIGSLFNNIPREDHEILRTERRERLRG